MVYDFDELRRELIDISDRVSEFDHSVSNLSFYILDRINSAELLYKSEGCTAHVTVLLENVHDDMIELKDQVVKANNR